MDEISKALITLEIGHLEGKVSKDVIEKARGHVSPVGTVVRRKDGKDWRKTVDGWEPVKSVKGGDKKEENENKDIQPGNKDKISNLYKVIDEDTQRAIKDLKYYTKAAGLNEDTFQYKTAKDNIEEGSRLLKRLAEKDPDNFEKFDIEYFPNIEYDPNRKGEIRAFARIKFSSNAVYGDKDYQNYAGDAKGSKFLMASFIKKNLISKVKSVGDGGVRMIDDWPLYVGMLI